MDCSICYSEINSSTGKVELSCSHSFHFSCLTTWFDKQNYQGMHANCPICRHEANEFEKMPEPIEDEEESDDTSDSSDDESLVEPQYTIEELAAQERARILFERLKFINPIEEVQAYAANKIKAGWRGYQDRVLFKERKLNIDEIASFNNRIEKYKKTLTKFIERDNFFKATSGLTRMERKNFAATKIQSRWRGHTVRLHDRARKQRASEQRLMEFIKDFDGARESNKKSFRHHLWITPPFFEYLQPECPPDLTS